jgi:NAD(P)-dependent dehydrogenase (short-subunit alcohol dehydrogenase family)
LASDEVADLYAVVGFSLTLRSEARGYGIKVNALCPGYMRTNIQKTIENVASYMNLEANQMIPIKLLPIARSVQ